MTVTWHSHMVLHDDQLVLVLNDLQFKGMEIFGVYPGEYGWWTIVYKQMSE